MANGLLNPTWNELAADESAATRGRILIAISSQGSAFDLSIQGVRIAL